MLRELGVDHVGIMTPKMEAVGWDKGRDMIRGAGLRVSNIAGEARVLTEAIELAAATGANVAYICSGGAKGAPWHAAAAAFADMMGPHVARANELGVRLAVEPTNPLRTDVSFVFTLRDAADLARATGIGVVLDVYSCWYERDLDAVVRDNLDLLALVQISDFVIGTLNTPNRAVIGDGDIPLERLLGMRDRGRLPAVRSTSRSSGRGSRRRATPPRSGAASSARARSSTGCTPDTADVMADRRGPLTDVRVIDLTQALAGPFCTMLLADLGADVIKIEPPQGDFTRYGGPFTKEDTERTCGGYFSSINRSKRSVVLDLKTPADRQILLQLVEGADVLVENFRPGVMDVSISPTRRWPPGIPRWSTARCAASAIRAPVPARTRIGRPSTSSPRRCPAWWRTPVRPAPPAPAWGRASATCTRPRCSRSASPPACTMPAGPARASSSTSPCTTRSSRSARIRSTAGATGGASTSPRVITTRSTFPSASSRPPTAPVPSRHPPSTGPCYARSIGRPDLVEDPRTRTNRDRNHNRALVEEVITAWTSARTTEQIVAELGGRVPVGPVHTNADLFDDPHLRQRDMLDRDRHAGRRPADDLRQHRDQVHENSRGRESSTSPAGRTHRRGAVGARKEMSDGSWLIARDRRHVFALGQVAIPLVRRDRMKRGREQRDDSGVGPAPLQGTPESFADLGGVLVEVAVGDLQSCGVGAGQ